VLLCGDFNTTPDSETVQVIMEHRLGLQSIWNVPWSKAGSEGSKTNGNGHSNGSSSSSNGSAAAAAAAASSNGNGNGKKSHSHGNGNGKHPDAQSSEAAAAGNESSSSASSPVLAEESAEFTTWKFRSTGAVKRTIDYIWYSKQQLAPISRWRMLSESEIGPEGLPSKQYPSDHMCVTCQFGWLEQ
jgi:mRNA deadenylase 3'-5' endonuclease subunit Ccr4